MPRKKKEKTDRRKKKSGGGTQNQVVNVFIQKNQRRNANNNRVITHAPQPPHAPQRLPIYIPQVGAYPVVQPIPQPHAPQLPLPQQAPQPPHAPQEESRFSRAVDFILERQARDAKDAKEESVKREPSFSSPPLAKPISARPSILPTPPPRLEPESIVSSPLMPSFSSLPRPTRPSPAPAPASPASAGAPEAKEEKEFVSPTASAQNSIPSHMRPTISSINRSPASPARYPPIQHEFIRDESRPGKVLNPYTNHWIDDSGKTFSEVQRRLQRGELPARRR
jgi:hypothetical protein